MESWSALGTAATLVELLVQGTRSGLRDRLVLDVCLELAGTSSGALWRAAGLGEWRTVVARGPRSELPTEAVVRTALAADAATQDDRWIRARAGDRGLAVVLGAQAGVSSGTAARDEIEALLAAVLLLEAAAMERGVDPPGPLPAGAGGRRDVEHDLRNVLASLSATEEVLERFGSELATTDRDRFLEAVDRECRRAGALLAAAVSTSAVDAERATPAAQIVADVVTLEGASRRASGVGVEIELDPMASSLVVRLDPQEWSRVVRNLVANAFEACAGGTTGEPIRVGIGLEPGDGGPSLRLRVEDGGIGLPALCPGRLILPGVTLGKPGGSGEGLAGVAWILRGCGGTLLVERLPRGSRFEVWVPAVPPGGIPGSPEKKTPRSPFSDPPARA